MIEYRNAAYNEAGTIDVEVNHPDFGWITFTADPNDCEEHGRKLFQDLQAEAAAFIEV